MTPQRFGLNRLPFAASAETPTFIDVPSRAPLVDALISALSDASGLALVTCLPGLGKTTLCRHLEQQLADSHEVAFLADPASTSRRSFLQAILHRLGQTYAGITETEARLALIDFVKNSDKPGGLALILDEAHRLNDRLLEELRSLSNQEADGRPLFRILLAADLELEERLMDPALSDVHQRIICHETLQPLTQEELAALLDAAIMAAGGDGWEHVFTRVACELLCLASDGSPKNLQVLVHRSLEVADRRREARVSVDAVREALDAVRDLPLNYYEPANLDDFHQRDLAEASHRDESAESSTIAIQPHLHHADLEPATSGWQEIVVDDPYARLDHRWEELRTEPRPPGLARESLPASAATTSEPELNFLEEIRELSVQVRHSSESLPSEPQTAASEADPFAEELPGHDEDWDLIEPEPDERAVDSAPVPDEVQQPSLETAGEDHIPAAHDADKPHHDEAIVRLQSTGEAPRDKGHSTRTAPHDELDEYRDAPAAVPFGSERRPYAQLFTRLRKLRASCAATHASRSDVG